MNNRKIMVVIPTRNRADLAMNAINSVLNQKGCSAADIIVSDNSTKDEEIAKLSEFCRKLGNSSVHYIRPPKPFPMSDHWNWALDQAFAISQAEYITYLTDRIVFRPTALKDLSAIIERYPGKVVSYSWDMILDSTQPIISFQLIRTAKLYEVASQDMMDLGADSIFNFSLPRMMNSICTRKTVEEIKKKYGRLFFTDNPDFNFGYTCLDVEESILFYDFPLLISYGAGVSNGTTFARGLFGKTSTTKDFIDTTKFNNIGEFVDKLPLSVTKHIAYEYDLIQRISGNSKFKEINKDKLVRKLLSIVMFYEDKEEKTRAFKQLYSINKTKFPWQVVYTYIDTYKLRGITKLKSKMRSRNALDFIESHQSLEDAMNYIINSPRPVTNSRIYFHLRVGRNPRELDVNFGASNGSVSS